MNLYSEFYGPGRKATVELINKHWDKSFNTWEVVMYQNEKVIQKMTVSSESIAENIAEDFVNGGNSDSMLLNEGLV
jgi:hypothetical protein